MPSLVFGKRTFEILKFIAQIFLPAFGTLYYTLAGIWGLPNPDEVAGTILALDAFLGLLLGLSTSNYKKSDARFDGHIDVEDQEDSKKFSLNLNSDPEDLEQKDEILFKVNKPESEVTQTVVKKPRKRPAKAVDKA